MMCEGLRQASTFRPAAPHVFANRPIRKEEIILVFRGVLTDFAETKPRGARRFNLPPGQPRPTMQGMFDTITAELATAADKLAHLRRFL